MCFSPASSVLLPFSTTIIIAEWNISQNRMLLIVTTGDTSQPPLISDFAFNLNRSLNYFIAYHQNLSVNVQAAGTGGFFG